MFSRYYTPPSQDREGTLHLFKLLRDIGLLFLLIVLAVVCWPFYVVPTGHRGVVTQFGEIMGVAPEGLNVLLPWRKLSVFNIRSEDAVIDKAEGATSDTQPVVTSLVIRYSVVPSRVAEVFEKYSHNGDLSSYIQSGGKEVFKAVTARYTAVDLINKRSDVSKAIQAALSDKIEKYGAQVINIDMTQFSFSESYMKAINEKVTQEQLRLGAENKLKTVEAEQKQKVAIAEAEASAVKATADGDAYATLTNAKARAESLRIQNAALSQSKDVLELRRIDVEQTKADRWNGQLPVNIYGSAPIPFLNAGKQ